METKENVLIVIVDDDAKLRKTLSDILRAKGYVPIAVETGKVAIDNVKEKGPAVALIDLKLEDMSGLDVMKEIKKCSPGTECIVLTGYASKKSAIEATNLGAYGYLEKPYDIDQLLVTIKRSIEKQKTEETLRKSERFLQDVFNAIRGGISVLDLDLKIVRVNLWMEEMYPEKGGLVGRKCYEVYQKRAAPCSRCPSLKTIETGKTHSVVVPYPSEENPTGWIDLSSFPLRNAKGDIVGVIEYVKDITQQKRTEELLRVERNNLLNISESIEDGIYIVNQQYDIQYVNPVLVKDFGYYEGRKCYEYFHDRDEICPWCKGQYVFAGETVHWEWYSFKNERTYDLIDTPITLPDGSIGKLEIFRDITERKKLEAQFIQAQKMEAIGTLAGGIAHDFNNLLTAIIGNAELALVDMDKNNPFYEYIQEMKNAGEHAASLTSQLLAFSRKQVIKPRDLDFNQEINLMGKMIWRLMGEDIEFSAVLEPELWKVYTDPGQMGQVIMNLLVNAKSAMPRGGKITIETVNVDLEKDFFHAHGVEEQPGPYVMFALSDTGIGMDKETQSRIFEPFFTTKERGSGTGLGLSTVYGIVKQNSGYIWVNSEPGEGTTFKIYLPKVKREAKSEEKERTITKDFKGSETVLIVEDDDRLRNLAQKILQQYGYRILKAHDGEEALKVCKEHKGPVHLLLTDVVMPKMSGKEVAEKLQSLRPETKVIYMSGYLDNTITRHGILAPEMNFLEKPFSPKGLARIVREVLDRGIEK